MGSRTALAARRSSSATRARSDVVACQHDEAVDALYATVRCHRDRSVVEVKLGRLTEPHVAALNAEVCRLRRGLGEAEAVPWFDPDDAGVDARILLLYESPGARSMSTASTVAGRGGSGFISVHNDDSTGAATYDLRIEAGLADASRGTSRWCLQWNVVPWYIGTAERIRTPDQSDLLTAQRALRRLLRRLPHLRVVLLMGRAAQRGWGLLTSTHPQDLIAIPAPHPSPRVLNTNSYARGQILSAFTDAARLVQ